MERVVTRAESTSERGADSLAAQALLGGSLGRGPAARTVRAGSAARRGAEPARFGSLVGDAGARLRPAVSRDLGRRFRHDFSRVRIHTGARAEQAARGLGAEAFSVGSHVVLGTRGLDLAHGDGRQLLAHELAHVTQPGPPVVRPYRSAKSFNFGVADDVHLKEQSFSWAKDRSTKPWISRVKVAFTSTATDADGTKYWKGTGAATYHSSPAKLTDFTFAVAGGSRSLGMSDAGTFTVHRIEGVGYNSGSFSGTAGVDFDPADREGPNKRYTKPSSTGFRASNMSLAVFYNKGEALHEGPLDVSSHGCVHVDWGAGGSMKQLNYHSVIGATKVTVSYPRAP